MRSINLKNQMRIGDARKSDARKKLKLHYVRKHVEEDFPDCAYALIVFFFHSVGYLLMNIFENIK